MISQTGSLAGVGSVATGAPDAGRCRQPAVYPHKPDDMGPSRPISSTHGAHAAFGSDMMMSNSTTGTRSQSIIIITRREQLPRGAGRDLSWRRHGERQARRGWRRGRRPACLLPTTPLLPIPPLRWSISRSCWRWCEPSPETQPAPITLPMLTDRAIQSRPLPMEILT